MRILIVEDETDIAQPLQAAFKAKGFSVDIAADGEAAVTAITKNTYDVIILDYLLPKKDGHEVCVDVRKQGVTTPILMLSIKSSANTKAEMLNIGADDYLSKPFSFEELLARVNSLLRRPPVMSGTELRVGDITLDTHTLSAKYKDQQIELSRKEFSLLEYLMRNQGRICSREEIMGHVWDSNADPFSNTIEVHVGNLRRRVDPEKKFIHTLSGRGYRIDNIK